MDQLTVAINTAASREAASAKMLFTSGSMRPLLAELPAEAEQCTSTSHPSEGCLALKGKSPEHYLICEDAEETFSSEDDF